MSNEEMEVKYGLPREVKYCKICAMSNQKPNTSNEYMNTSGDRHYMDFDEEGVCAACRYHFGVKEKIDWEERDRKLRKLLSKYRRHDGRHDVIVPVSGGKDSVFATLILKEKYGMHPLTVTWAPHIYRKVGWDNLQRLIHNAGGVDNLLYTPNGRVHRLLTSLAFLNQLHPFQPFVFGQKNLGPRASIAYDVPLVMYGESNIEYGDPADTDDEEMTVQRYAMEVDIDNIYLAGISLRDLIDKYDLTLHDVNAYLPVKPEKLRKVGTRVHYLGHYVKWDPQECYYFAVEKVGLKASEERSDGTYSKYTEMDDKMPPINFHCMHVKFGVGRAMYDASQEVRNGKITREEAVALIRKFDGEYPRLYFDECLEYMNLTKEEYDETCDKFRSPHLFKKENGKWVLRHPVV